MNAYELAQYLEVAFYPDEDIAKTAVMLRKQADEIKALKSKTLTEDTECQYCKQGCIRCDARKLLTNEEIINIAKEHIHQRLEGERFGYVDFARAILRKAQEK